VATEIERQPAEPLEAALWSSLKAHPGYAPELLALAAVDRLAPLVREQLAWLRNTYPDATADGLARLATVRGVRQARVRGAMAGLVGPLAVLAEAVGLAWLQARLLLDVSAAYGRDPAEPERAAELLALQRVHPDLDSARAALAAARRVAEHGPAEHGAAEHGAADEGQQAPRLTVQVVRAVGGVLLKMSAAGRTARIVPGAGAALTAVLDARSTERLAARASRFYRSQSQE
jgi:hypothetical protein